MNSAGAICSSGADEQVMFSRRRSGPAVGLSRELGATAGKNRSDFLHPRQYLSRSVESDEFARLQFLTRHIGHCSPQRLYARPRTGETLDLPFATPERQRVRVAELTSCQ